jgi:ATP-dependent RNA helicase RhlE
MPFSIFKLHVNLRRGIRDLGFQRPTPIQEQAIPPGCAGSDVLACAATGSGKTAAFLLPILDRLIDRPRGATRALVLTPTRELAAQIHQHLEELATHTPVTGAAIHGGVGLGPQEHALRAGADVIIATPGRLLDHMSRAYARLSDLEILVLDVADRMLDMGFLPDIRRILRQLPRRRQTLFFSATMPREIASLASEMLVRPVTINLERRAAPAAGIRHAVYPVTRELKAPLLADLIERNLVADAIVFTRTKHRANRLAEFLDRRGFPAARIHGNRSQSQRTAALEGFKAGRHRLLVATDIVARGIDVEALGHVINFDVPADPEAYIHRVGRTARADATGDAFTFVSPEEEGDLRAIERAIGRSLPRVTLPGFDYTKRSTERLEIPLHERLAAHRAQRRGTASGRSAKGTGAGERPAARPAKGARGRRRTSSAGALDRRAQAILDRHAPLAEAPATRGPAAGKRRR